MESDQALLRLFMDAEEHVVPERQLHEALRLLVERDGVGRVEKEHHRRRVHPGGDRGVAQNAVTGGTL